MNFFRKYKVLYEDQYGFRQNNSPTDAILKFTDLCYSNFNNKEYLISVFLDFSRAFDTVVHSILCDKLEKCGIRGFMSSWFRSYLEGRTQYVVLNGKASPSANITCSVPHQGSILGPLCFLIYINDMNRCSRLNIVHFADDSTVFSSNMDLDALTVSVNSELDKIDHWLRANKLSLNVKKSSFTIYFV